MDNEIENAVKVGVSIYLYSTCAGVVVGVSPAVQALRARQVIVVVRWCEQFTKAQTHTLELPVTGVNNNGLCFFFQWGAHYFLRFLR